MRATETKGEHPKAKLPLNIATQIWSVVQHKQPRQWQVDGRQSVIFVFCCTGNMREVLRNVEKSEQQGRETTWNLFVRTSRTGEESKKRRWNWRKDETAISVCAA